MARTRLRPRRVGVQVPTYRWCADYSLTYGPVASFLASSYGMEPHPWQRAILDDWLAIDATDHLVNTTCVLPVPRQNGKTGVCDPRETFGLVERGEWILHTAQEYQTSRKAFDRLRQKFGDRRNDKKAKYPELNRLIDRYTTSANQMVLDLKNGGHIEFRTRGSGGDMGRGGTFDLIVVDEAQSYTEEQDAALAPLNSAAPSGSPQTILMGTVPDPTRPHKGVVFRNLRDAAHDDPYEGICIHEWATEDVGDPRDEERWFEFNPSLGYQLLVAGLRKDSRSMSAERFAMEHLGWWGAFTSALNPIDSHNWNACRIERDAVPYGRLVYAVKFAPDGRYGTIGVAVVPDGDAPIHVEVAESMSLGRGVGAFAEWLMDVADDAEAIVIDGSGDARSLEGELYERGMDGDMVVRPSTNDSVSAYADLVNATRARALTHVDDELLDEAARGCTKRRIGTAGGYGFESNGNADATALEAVAHAYHEALGLRREPTEETLEVW